MRRHSCHPWASAAIVKATRAVPRISSLLAASRDRPTFSFEFFPPRSPAGERSLQQRIAALSEQSPLFVDVTWNPSTCVATPKLCHWIQDGCGIPCNMHVTAQGLTHDELTTALDYCVHHLGIRNFMPLRGDSLAAKPGGSSTTQSFATGLDLLRFIKARFGDAVCVSAPGYPEGHPLCAGHDPLEKRRQDIRWVKEKVAAGAEVIVTQCFCDPQVFLEYVARCRDAAIDVPIVPGMLPITSYRVWNRFRRLAHLQCSRELAAAVDHLQHGDNLLREFGVLHCAHSCGVILQNPSVKHLHFYTLNQDYSTVRVLSKLGVFVPDAGQATRELLAQPKYLPESREPLRQSVRAVFKEVADRG